MGLALMKLDSWIKEDVARYRAKASLLYRATPLLYASVRKIQKREVSVYDTIRFPKLRDDEIFWLKSLESRAVVGKEHRRTLFQTEELDLTYRYYPVKIERDGTAVQFVRVLP